MKKILSIGLGLCLCIMCMGTASNANYFGPVELKGTDFTVAEALMAKGGTEGYIKGNIVAQLSSDEYRFQDGTGTMVVVINQNVFPNQSLDENSVIYIVGEVDASRRRPNKLFVEMLKLAD